MSSTSARSQRARVAVLTRYRDADDPELVEARARLSDTAFIAAIERAIAAAPVIRPEARDRVIALLSTTGTSE